MTRKLVAIIVALQIGSYQNDTFACDQLNLQVTGQLSESSPALSKASDGSSELSNFYDVPLDLLGIEGEQARLVFTRTLPSIWRVDVQLSDLEPLTSAPTILTRSAATLIEFSEDGKQTAEQTIVIFPSGGSSKKNNTSVTIALRDFTRSKNNTTFKQDYFIDPEAECVEPRKIISVKTKPDNVRDELNPYLPGDKQ